MRFSRLSRIVALVGALMAFATAHGQPANWPEKPIHVIVGYAPGGGNDTVARILSEQLAQALGQPVVVENKSGAAGGIAAAHVARSNPDGYTLLFAPSSMFTTNPVVFKKLPYSLSDFVPVSTAVTYPLILVVGASQPQQSVKELVDFLKANPARANFAGAAGLFQLAFELFKSQTGTQGEYIPYMGTNQSVSALISGEVLMTMADAGPVSGALKADKVRGLAVTSRERLPAYPSIPTVVEAGYPGLVMGSWMGLLAPAGTPAVIVRKLQQEVNLVTRSPAFQERMNALDVKAEGSTSEEFANLIEQDLERWRGVAKESNITPTH